MPTYEMFWDCRSCGSKKLLGKTHRHCPHCGQAQDPSWRYFPAENEKVAVENHKYVGVDWVCERCDTPNSNSATHCVNCGDARDGVEVDVKLKGEVLAGNQTGKRKPELSYEATQAAAKASYLKSERRKRWLWYLLLVVGVGSFAMAVFCLVSILWVRPTQVTVKSHSWERSVAVDQFDSRSDSAWCDRMPSDAYRVSRSQKVRSTNQIPDGESCSTSNVDNGDGTFSTRQTCHTTYRSEDVYDDYCSYTVDRWGYDHTASSEGVGLRPKPSWPKTGSTNCRRLGCTRDGKKRESYYVHLVDGDNDERTCDYSQPRWRSMKPGSVWDAKKFVIWDNVDCSSLMPLGAK